ncbi:unnamed protein product [Effrenium voratum]|uniref:Uncharacterized protein n=1 Tax=Effrenium voratum TaxID=2562239 RepID=A0AA36N3G9_9DINO|nr:unnamed protein product [Effrenium voratum]
MSNWRAVPRVSERSSWARGPRRGEGGRGYGGDIYGALSPGLREQAEGSVEELVNKMEGWSMELQRHCAEDWNQFASILIQCLSGESKKDASQQQFQVAWHGADCLSGVSGREGQAPPSSAATDFHRRRRPMLQIVTAGLEAQDAEIERLRTQLEQMSVRASRKRSQSQDLFTASRLRSVEAAAEEAQRRHAAAIASTAQAKDHLAERMEQLVGAECRRSEHQRLLGERRAQKVAAAAGLAALQQQQEEVLQGVVSARQSLLKAEQVWEQHAEEEIQGRWRVQSLLQEEEARLEAIAPKYRRQLQESQAQVICQPEMREEHAEQVVEKLGHGQGPSIQALPPDASRPLVCLARSRRCPAQIHPRHESGGDVEVAGGVCETGAPAAGGARCAGSQGRGEPRGGEHLTADAAAAAAPPGAPGSRAACL